MKITIWDRPGRQMITEMREEVKEPIGIRDWMDGVSNSLVMLSAILLMLALYGVNAVRCPFHFKSASLLTHTRSYSYRAI